MIGGADLDDYPPYESTGRLLYSNNELSILSIVNISPAIPAIACSKLHRTKSLRSVHLKLAKLCVTVRFIAVVKGRKASDGNCDLTTPQSRIERLSHLFHGKSD